MHFVSLWIKRSAGTLPFPGNKILLQTISGPRDTIPGMDYSHETGEFIASNYGSGSDSLAKLHENYPDLVPAPYYVQRWRRQFPTFDALMKEAEESKAEYLAHELIEIADEGDPKQAAVQLRARQWLASRLSKAKYGTAGENKAGHLVQHEHVHKLDDATLQAIASRGAGPGDDAKVIEHEAEGGHPPAGDGTPAF